MAPHPGIRGFLIFVRPAPSTWAVFAHRPSQPALAEYLGPESVRSRGGKYGVCRWGGQEECEGARLD